MLPELPGQAQALAQHLPGSQGLCIQRLFQQRNELLGKEKGSQGDGDVGMRGRRQSAQDREGPQVKGEWPQAQPLLQVCGRASAALVEPDLGGEPLPHWAPW